MSSFLVVQQPSNSSSPPLSVARPNHHHHRRGCSILLRSVHGRRETFCCCCSSDEDSAGISCSFHHSFVSSSLHCSAIPVPKMEYVRRMLPSPLLAGLHNLFCTNTTTDHCASISSHRPRTPRALNLTLVYQPASHQPRSPLLTNLLPHTAELLFGNYGALRRKTLFFTTKSFTSSWASY